MTDLHLLRIKAALNEGAKVPGVRLADLAATVAEALAVPMEDVDEVLTLILVERGDVPPRRALPAGIRLSGERVRRLSRESFGTWLVATAGSHHIWEIEPGQIWWTRLPGRGRSQFDFDEERLLLTRVDRWPAIWDTALAWFDTPGDWLSEQWRQSSWVRWIERLADAG